MIREAGGAAPPRDLYSKLATEFQLTDNEQQELLDSGPRKWWNLVQWVRQRLVEKGQIDGSTRGVWKITAAGEARRDGSPGFLLPPSPIPVTSESTLRDVVTAQRDEVKRRILTELRSLSSHAFERFCSALLQRLGFEDITVTKRSADGGIDGFGNFRQGAVSIRSAFQAKRWKESSTIGRPEIDKFRGAIQGDFDHGVFLTTSKFSREAESSSFKKGGVSTRTIDRHVARLRGMGVLVLTNPGGGRQPGTKRSGRPATYRLDPAALPSRER